MKEILVVAAENNPVSDLDPVKRIIKNQRAEQQQSIEKQSDEHPAVSNMTLESDVRIREVTTLLSSE